MDIDTLPIIDVTNGVDPNNLKWRTNSALYDAVNERYVEMQEFMNSVRINRMSTHLTFNGTKFRVLIDKLKATD